jgi:hypothetical protein
MGRSHAVRVYGLIGIDVQGHHVIGLGGPVVAA